MNSYSPKICYALLLLLLHTAGSIVGYQWATKSGDVKCKERERQALLNFKEGIEDDDGMLSTWRGDEDNVDCCKWRGIECSNETGHVLMLDLHGDWDTHYLTGEVNLTLLIELQSLEHLDLSDNYFYGSQISEHIGSFSNLRYLNLSGSDFGGRIPYQLGKLAHLQYLDLSNNYLVGAIPYQLGKLAHLQYLDLSNNYLVGAIRYQLRDISKLKYLNLRGNSLNGTIPFQIGDLPLLQTLGLSVNYNLKIKEENHDDAEWLSSLSPLTNLDLTLQNLSSSPHWLQTISKLIPNLRELRLSECGLSDNDIVSLFDPHSNSSTSLTILDLSYNMLTSSAFQWLFNFSFNLQELHPSDNNFVLSSSSKLNLSSVVILDLSYNKLTSSLFQGNFFSSSKLQQLYLSNCSLLDNSFLVSYSSRMNFSSSLVILDLSYNLLTSSAIFHWLSNFTTTLRAIYLYGNSLEGPIPDGFSKVMNSLENLDLSRNKLQGEIPASFGNICTLRRLYLSYNNLSGEISSFIQNSSWCNRYIFQALYLSYNRITGMLPKSIGLLSELDDLDLSWNSLEGDVTESHLTNFSKLKSLSLSYNSLSLKFSSSWVPPFQLRYLGLASCKMGPNFPCWVQTQRKLRRIDISNAGISDTVPLSFWNISQTMSMMNISHNSLRGRIPNLPLKFAYDPVIILTSNQFEGSIPPFLLKASLLHLSKNRFSNLESLLCANITTEALYILDVSDNQLKGQLPDCWNLGNLEALFLRNNSLIGRLPSSMKKLTGLHFLDLGENQLSGPIPSWIGENLHQLVILSLRVNHFSGSMPPQLCYLTQIKLLDLSENLLSEKILPCLKNITAMARTSYGDFSTFAYYELYVQLMWKGIEYMFKDPELRLNSIDLSSNHLSGEMPTELGSLFGLISLNLSRNNLTGEINSNLGNLKSLEFLDLSRNHLSGRIPSSLAHIDRLSVLDLSNNHLIGKIPIGTQLQTFDPSSYEGNLDLCGKPLDKICPEDETTIPHVPLVFDPANEESIFSGAFYMSLGLGFAVGFWGFIGPLLLCHSWRYFYIRFLSKLSDNIYIMITIYVGRCRRWLTG